MKKSSQLVGLVMASFLTVTLVSCSSGNFRIDLQAGWEHQLLSYAALDLDSEFNIYTGEIVEASPENGTGLTLRTSEAPEDAEKRTAAIADAKQLMCEWYVDPIGSDPLLWQGFTIRSLLTSAIESGMISFYPEGYGEAEQAVQEWIEVSGPKLSAYEQGSERYNKALERRNELIDERWEEEFPELLDARLDVQEKLKEAGIAAFTSENVRSAQDFYVRTCDVQVPTGYEYPTPNDLGILVDDEFVESLG
ncbi:hypothetical protein [Humidisolicoccus flavus]|uniref:hypothetical protein n=1 Tax=Humidisolicoccus flavus TaxID=3111414 RepID=UPI003245ADDD